MLLSLGMRRGAGPFSNRSPMSRALTKSVDSSTTLRTSALICIMTGARRQYAHR